MAKLRHLQPFFVAWRPPAETEAQGVELGALSPEAAAMIHAKRLGVTEATVIHVSQVLASGKKRTWSVVVDYVLVPDYRPQKAVHQRTV